jgi:uncharacterized protein (UPF0332 family)
MAEEKLQSAKILLDAGMYKDSIGRSYYAIFSAVRAVLAKDNVDFSRHSGVIAYFQKEYIKTEKLTKNIPNIFKTLSRYGTTVIMMISTLFHKVMQLNSMIMQLICLDRLRNLLTRIVKYD